MAPCIIAPSSVSQAMAPCVIAVLLVLCFSRVHVAADLPCPPNLYCPTAAAPYQCFVAAGSASKCCGSPCGVPPANAAALCGGAGVDIIAPTAPHPSPYACTLLPSPSPKPQGTGVPGSNLNCPTVAFPLQCFVADGSAYGCCPVSSCVTPPPSDVFAVCAGGVKPERTSTGAAVATAIATAFATSGATAAASVIATSVATVAATKAGTSTPMATSSVATVAVTKAGTSAPMATSATSSEYPPAPVASTPVVNPFAAGQTCSGGITPLTCPQSACITTCPRYPASQCVTDECDNCQAKYNLDVGLVDHVGWQVNCTCPDGKSALGESYSVQTPLFCKPDPCSVLSCPAVPDAKCVTDTCGGCSAIFLVKGVEVACGLKTRFPGTNVTAGGSATSSTTAAASAATTVPSTTAAAGAPSATSSATTILVPSATTSSGSSASSTVANTTAGGSLALNPPSAGGRRAWPAVAAVLTAAAMGLACVVV